MLVILKRWLNMITWNSKFHVVIAALKWSNLCHHQTQVLPRNISYHISHPLCWTELHLNKMKMKALCGACSSYMWRQIPMSHLPWESETGMRVRITVSISFCMLLCSVSMAQRITDLFSSFFYIYIYIFLFWRQNFTMMFRLALASRCIPGWSHTCSSVLASTD